MALNQPICESFTLEDIISDNLHDLKFKLKKEGVNVEVSDFIYSIFDRCEYLGLYSEKLYPGEDLPEKFGVHRGYAGGGIHSGLIHTEHDRMSKNRQAKAGRLLDLFEATFWQILKDSDNATEEATGEELQDWDKLTL